MSVPSGNPKNPKEAVAPTLHPSDSSSGAKQYPTRRARGKASESQPSSQKLPRLDYDPAEYQLVRHLPRQYPRGPGDVYITLKTPFKAQMDKCKKLLETPGCKEITLHGMGAATNRAANLALQLQLDYDGLIELAARTGSVEMTNELEPLRDDLDPITDSRFISVIHIRLYFLKLLEDLKAKAEVKTE